MMAHARDLNSADVLVAELRWKERALVAELMSSSDRRKTNELESELRSVRVALARLLKEPRKYKSVHIQTTHDWLEA